MQSLDIKDHEEFLKVENMMCIRQMLVFVSAGNILCITVLDLANLAEILQVKIGRHVKIQLMLC